MIVAPASFTTANANLVKAPVLAFEIDGYRRVFTNRPTGVDGHYPWVKEIGDLSFEVSALDGSCSLGDLVVSVIDYERQMTADYPQQTLEGRTCRLKTGYLSQPYNEYVTLFTGKLENIPTADQNLTYQFIAKDTRLDLKQLVYLTGDDGRPTDNDHPKTVIGHPLDILQSILLDYLKLNPADVDSAKLNTYRDELLAGALFEFHITSPPEAKAFIESQLMKPLAGYLRASNLGKLTPQFFSPIAGSNIPVMTLDYRNILGVPEIQQADLVNCVSFRFDKDGDKFRSESIQQHAASIAKYGIQGQQVIESDGIRSGFQGFFISSLTSKAIFGRVGDKNPKVELQCLWDTCLLEPGDLVAVTHNLIPDRKGGTMGVVAQLFEIENFSRSFSNFTTTMTLVDASFVAGFGAYRIAPDSKVDWTLAVQADKDRYMYISGADGKYSNGDIGHNLA